MEFLSLSRRRYFSRNVSSGEVKREEKRRFLQAKLAGARTGPCWEEEAILCTTRSYLMYYKKLSYVLRHIFYAFQGRLFSYHDTHLHRLGTNYLQLPVNCPYRTRVTNYQRDGPQTFDNQGIQNSTIFSCVYTFKWVGSCWFICATVYGCRRFLQFLGFKKPNC